MSRRGAGVADLLGASGRDRPACDQSRRSGQPAGRSSRLAASGSGPGASGQAGALESGRSNVAGRPAQSASAVGVGRIADAPGNGAGLASRLSAAEVGSLPRPTAAGETADLGREPEADPEDGQGEPELGLPADWRRASQARLQGGGDDHSRCSAFASASRLELEAIPGPGTLRPWSRLASSASTGSPSSASTSFSICTWRRGGFCSLPAPAIRTRPGSHSRPATCSGRWRRKGSGSPR